MDTGIMAASLPQTGMGSLDITHDEVMSMTAEERDALLAELVQWLQPGDPSKLHEMAAFYLKLAERVEKQQMLLEAAQVDLLEGERVLVQIMKECQIGNFTFQGTAFKVTREKKISVLAENRPLQHQWLRDAGHGDLIVPQEPKVNEKTFGAYIKNEIMAQGLPIPDFVKVYEYDKLTVKAGKK